MTNRSQRTLETASPKRRRIRRTNMVAMSVMSLCLVLTPVQPALADFNTTVYTRGSNCSGRKDPINFVFWGPNAWWDKAGNHVQHHTGWGVPNASRQTTNVHGTCYLDGTQRASGAFYESRYHIRIFYAHYDRNYSYSVGDAHWEAAIYCGHAVPPNGFDGGKNVLRDLMRRGGHTVSTVWWGNTDRFKQCNGKYAGSDGYTVRAYIG
jgi:hypothetical protein